MATASTSIAAAAGLSYHSVSGDRTMGARRANALCLQGSERMRPLMRGQRF